MSSSGLVRLGGLAAVVAAALLLTDDIIDAYNIDAHQTAELNRQFLTTGTHAFESALRLIAFGVLLPLGLVGLYARQSEAAGPLGLVGFVVAFAGTMLVSGFVWVDTFVAPELATSAPRLIESGPPPGHSLSFLVFGIGWALFGLASLVGRLYPRSASALLIVGAVIVTVLSLTLLPVPLGGLPFLAAVVWLGVALLTGWGSSASTATLARELNFLELRTCEPRRSYLLRSSVKDCCRDLHCVGERRLEQRDYASTSSLQRFSKRLRKVLRHTRMNKAILGA